MKMLYTCDTLPAGVRCTYVFHPGDGQRCAKMNELVLTFFLNIQIIHGRSCLYLSAGPFTHVRAVFAAARSLSVNQFSRVTIWCITVCGMDQVRSTSKQVEFSLTEMFVWHDFRQTNDVHRICKRIFPRWKRKLCTFDHDYFETFPLWSRARFLK